MAARHQTAIRQSPTVFPSKHRHPNPLPLRRIIDLVHSLSFHLLGEDNIRIRLLATFDARDEAWWSNAWDEAWAISVTAGAVGGRVFGTDNWQCSWSFVEHSVPKQALRCDYEAVDTQHGASPHESSHSKENGHAGSGEGRGEHFAVPGVSDSYFLWELLLMHAIVYLSFPVFLPCTRSMIYQHLSFFTLTALTTGDIIFLVI